MQTQQEEYTNNQTLQNNTSDGARTANARNEIVIHDLVRHFGDVTAVNGLNLEIRKGQFFGFLGPNGAGNRPVLATHVASADFCSYQAIFSNLGWSPLTTSCATSSSITPVGWKNSIRPVARQLCGLERGDTV